MSRTPIAVCVDDFGLHAAVNTAVFKLFAHGRISVTSCMVGAPAWQAGAATLRQLPADQLDVGLHLDLIEHPLDARLRHSLRGWLVRSYTRSIPLQWLRAEIAAQLDAFELAMGRPPAHVDGHQHVHQFPVVREILLDLLAERYSARAARPWLRQTRGGRGQSGKARWIGRLGAGGLERKALALGFRQNAHMLGVYDFTGSESHYRALLRSWLAQAAQGDLLMCHPACGMVPGDAIAQARQREFKVLDDPAFDMAVAQSAVEVWPMSRILSQSPASS